MLSFEWKQSADIDLSFYSGLILYSEVDEEGADAGLHHRSVAILVGCVERPMVGIRRSVENEAELGEEMMAVGGGAGSAGEIAITNRHIHALEEERVQLQGKNRTDAKEIVAAAP